MATWQQIESDPNFPQDTAEQQRLRERYFNNVISADPKFPTDPEGQAQLRQRFFGVKPEPVATLPAKPLVEVPKALLRPPPAVPAPVGLAEEVTPLTPLMPQPERVSPLGKEAWREAGKLLASPVVPYVDALKLFVRATRSAGVTIERPSAAKEKRFTIIPPSKTVTPLTPEENQRLTGYLGAAGIMAQIGATVVLGAQAIKDIKPLVGEIGNLIKYKGEVVQPEAILRIAQKVDRGEKLSPWQQDVFARIQALEPKVSRAEFITGKRPLTELVPRFGVKAGLPAVPEITPQVTPAVVPEALQRAVRGMPPVVPAGVPAVVPPRVPAFRPPIAIPPITPAVVSPPVPAEITPPVLMRGGKTAGLGGGEYGIYLTPDEKYAKVFAGKEGIITKAVPNIKKIYQIKPDEVSGEWVDALIESPQDYSGFIKELKSKGYDAIQSSDGKQLLVLDPKAVKEVQPQVTPAVVSPPVLPEITPPTKVIPPPAKEVAPVTAREPWEMTRNEYLRIKDKESALSPGKIRNLITLHKTEVRGAIKDNKPVPPEVLAEYPDLAPAVKKAIPAELEPLAVEARKYKTAEEFEKAITEPLKTGDMMTGVKIGDTKYNWVVANNLDKAGHKNLTSFYNQAKGITKEKVGLPTGLKRRVPEKPIVVTAETPVSEIKAKVDKLPLFPNKEENLQVLKLALRKAVMKDFELLKPEQRELTDEEIMEAAKHFHREAGKESPVTIKVDGTWKIENSPQAILKAIEGIERPKLEYVRPSLYKKPALTKAEKEELEPLLKQIREAKIPAVKPTPEFIEEGPTIGLVTKDIIPTSIRVAREPEDLVGLKGFLESIFLPVRHVTGDNPIAIRIAKMGREVMLNLSSEQTHYNERIDDAYRGLSPAQKEQVVDTLEGKATTLNVKQQKAHRVSNEIRTEMREMSEKDIGIDISKWGITPEEYWPHVFIGSYQIKDGTKTIEGGFARDLREAIDKAVAYIKVNPKADINIAPKDFGDEYTATLLSRRGFWRFITEVKKATTLDKNEILSMMRGVAAIKPRGKFVGNFQQREANLGGYLKNEVALKIYTNRILRKKWLDPFRKEATELATQLPPALKEYFDEYIGAVSGKYDPVNNKFIMSRISGKITGLQSKLKLGYRPTTALVNKLQPLQTAYAEIGNHLFRGQRFKKTPEGQRVLQDAKIAGQQPKYYTGEFLGKAREPAWKPLGMFSKGEMANREDVIAGGYLFASEVFKLPKEQATKQGYDYILLYLDQYKDSHTAAVEYAKDLNADTNYIYDVSDVPKILRHPIGRVMFQFKTFPINFTVQSYKWLKEAITGPTPHNIARAIRFTSANLLLGGVRTIPYVGRWLWKAVVFGAIASVLHPKIKKVLGRGIFSLIGVDLSQRLGPNDFLPRNLRDALGPTIGDLYTLYQYARGDITLGEAITKPTGALRDLYRAFRETEYVADPRKRWRKIVETTGWDKFLQSIGAPNTKVETTRDMQVIINELEREYKKKKAKYVDGIITRKNKGERFNDIIKQAKEEGIILTRKDVETEEKKKEMTAMERRLETTPKALREKIRGMVKRGF